MREDLNPTLYFVIFISRKCETDTPPASINKHITVGLISSTASLLSFLPSALPSSHSQVLRPSQLSSSTNRRMKPSIPPPLIIIDLTSNQQAQPISVMAEEFIFGFEDLQKDDSNNERLVDFVRSHYSSSLISPDFCSTLQRRLDTANENDLPPFFHNFFCDDLSRLVSDHSMIVNTLKPMNVSFNKELDSINISQKVSAVFFIAAVIICTAASAIATANANPEWAWAAVAGAATAAPVASILFGALGNWRYSVLCKSETAVRKHKEITTRMILAADCGIKDLINIDFVASKLEFETNSLSETVDDSKKVAAVKSSSEELLKKVKNYNGEIKWVKQKVLDIIIKP